jgi:hypothetical protein
MELPDEQKERYLNYTDEQVFFYVRVVDAGKAKLNGLACRTCKIEGETLYGADNEKYCKKHYAEMNKESKFERYNVLENALKDLIAYVGDSHRIARRDENNTTVQLFKILRDNAEPFTPEEARACLIENNWNEKDAQVVADIAKKVLEHRRLRTGRPIWKKDIIDKWRRNSTTKRLAEKRV